MPRWRCVVGNHFRTGGRRFKIVRAEGPVCATCYFANLKRNPEDLVWRHKSRVIDPKTNRHCGTGLFAAKPIKADTRITKFTGKVYNEPRHGAFVVQCFENSFLDALPHKRYPFDPKAQGAFANTANKPSDCNASIKVSGSAEKPVVSLRAKKKRRIAVDEEILVSYGAKFRMDRAKRQC